MAQVLSMICELLYRHLLHLACNLVFTGLLTGRQTRQNPVRSDTVRRLTRLGLNGYCGLDMRSAQQDRGSAAETRILEGSHVVDRFQIGSRVYNLDFVDSLVLMCISERR